MTVNLAQRICKKRAFVVLVWCGRKVCTALYGAMPTLNSNEGDGTKISFVAELFPVVLVGGGDGSVEVLLPEPVALAAPFDFVDTTPRRCLIIYDQRVNRTMLRRSRLSRVLPESTRTFIEARSGEEAVEMAAKMATEGELIDLTFVDYHMKELTGAQTVAQLKVICSSTVCIGSSGTGNAEVQEFIELDHLFDTNRTSKWKA